MCSEEMEIKFNYHRANARKDLLHFIEEKVDSKICEKIGKDADAWLEELSMIHGMLNGCPISCSTGIHAPPLDSPEFKKLGEKIYLYNGKEARSLWTFNGKDSSNPSNWTHYSIGSSASLAINKRYSIMPESLLPENFEKISEKVIKKKGLEETAVEGRPILKFEADDKSGKTSVYAKGAQIVCTYFYDYAKPKYRLTSISSATKIDSKGELEKTAELMNAGVKVPDIIGYYESLAEDFIFLGEVKGKSPLKCMDKKQDMIKQDAEMLSAICCAGYFKPGFTDFDDKIFDSKNLYLIDIDECLDIYAHFKPEYRKMLLNPNDTEELGRFRKFQTGFFRQMLKDAIFEYQENLTQSRDDKKLYITSFYRHMKWPEPSEKEIKSILRFPKNYITHESAVCMANDTD
jgi:hypothetical protein